MEFHQTVKHIPIFKTNTYDENLELGANVIRVIALCNSNNGIWLLCICIFFSDFCVLI